METQVYALSIALGFEVTVVVVRADCLSTTTKLFSQVSIFCARNASKQFKLAERLYWRYQVYKVLGKRLSESCFPVP